MPAGARVLACITCLTCASPPGSRISPVPHPATSGQLGTSSPHLPALGVSPGLLDTLIAIAGAPRALEIVSMADTLLAMYHNTQDSIAVSTVVPASPRHKPGSRADARTRISPDWVISHEFGHRYDFHREHRPCRRWAPDVTRVTGANYYANTNRQERFAEAFANAIDYLRYTAVLGTHDIESLVQREYYVPGTFDVVRVLLRHRIYRGHPLSDATSRRK